MFGADISTIDNPMEHTMNRLLIAATLGLALLAGGGTLGSAMDRPVHQDTSRNPGVLAVHYEHSEGRFERHQDRVFHRHHHRHEWPRSYGYDRW